MSDAQLLTPDDLARRVEQSSQEDRKLREPVFLAWLTVILVIALCLGMFWVEFENISLALRQLFPTYRDGTSDLSGTHTLGFASIGAILCGHVLLRQASQSWSERTRGRIYLVGLAALALFAVSVMVLIPTSIWHANDASQDGGGAVANGTYLAFALMLASLFPLSVLANFVLIEKAEAALAKIARSTTIDRRINRKRQLLARRESTRAELNQIEQQRTHAPADAQLSEEHAARSAAVIGEVAGQLKRTIMARQAGTGSTDAPLIASDVALLNHLPVEKLQDHLDYLTEFTPDAIKRILEKESQS